MSYRNPAVLGEWGKDGKRTVNADWRKPLAWDRAAKKAGERRRVFPSLCDPFEEFGGKVVTANGGLVLRSNFQEILAGDDVWGLDDIREEFFSLIRRTQNLDWLVLTKRPQNATGMMRDWREAWDDMVLPNLWLGTSVEDQQRADERTPHLLETPAAVRWLSVEPMLGPIDLTPWLESVFVADFDPADRGYITPSIDWVVIGGESGPHARPCNLAWIRSIVAQCKAAGVPCFVKQLGARPFDGIGQGLRADGSTRNYIRVADPKGGDISQFPEDLKIREFPNAV
jgi:protein gp37